MTVVASSQKPSSSPACSSSRRVPEQLLFSQSSIPVCSPHAHITPKVKATAQSFAALLWGHMGIELGLIPPSVGTSRLPLTQGQPAALGSELTPWGFTCEPGASAAQAGSPSLLCVPSS